MSESNFFQKASTLISKLILQYQSQISSLTDKKEITGIQFKIKNYKKWLASLDHYVTNPTKITSESDIKALDFAKISPKLESRLLEIFSTGTLADLAMVDPYEGGGGLEKVGSEGKKKAESAGMQENIPKILEGEVRPSDERGGAIWDLRLVHGIGPANAVKLADADVRLDGLLSEWRDWVAKDPANGVLLASKMQRPVAYTAAQWSAMDEGRRHGALETDLNKRLKAETKMLCKIHRCSLVGLKYFHDMGHKIPRTEIERAEKILKRVAEHLNKDIVVMLCGSYRRGRDKSGDIDCFITHPAIKTKEDLERTDVNLLASFRDSLIKVGFIVDQLDMGQVKFMGFCKVPEKGKKESELIARRIDIRFVPSDSFGSAILYFTGSKTFNTEMRKHALKKGYSLSEFGLKKKDNDVLIPCATEEEVFKILNYPYKTPKERDI